MFLFAKTGMKQKFMNSMQASTGKLQFHHYYAERQTALKVLLKKERFVCFYHTWTVSSFCYHFHQEKNAISFCFLLRLFPLFTRFIVLKCILVCLCVTNDFVNLSKASHFSPGLSKTRWDPALRYSKWISEWNPSTIMKAQWKPTETIPFNENKCSYCSWLEF